MNSCILSDIFENIFGIESFKYGVVSSFKIIVTLLLAKIHFRWSFMVNIGISELSHYMRDYILKQKILFEFRCIECNRPT